MSGFGCCQFAGCDREASGTAIGRSHQEFNDDGDYVRVPGLPFGYYCEEHRATVADENSPEYHHECPHCGCLSGVG